MRIKLLVPMAGPDGAHSAGALLTVDEETGAAWLRGGYAEKIVPPPLPKPETATDPAAGVRETRAQPETQAGGAPGQTAPSPAGEGDGAKTQSGAAGTAGKAQGKGPLGRLRRR